MLTLRYGIEAKKGFIVITGEVGTGKTTLLRKLLHTLADTVHSVLIFNSCLSFPEILQVTLQDLGLTRTDHSKVQMLQELNDYLIKQLRLSHTVMMLIDEAQNRAMKFWKILDFFRIWKLIRKNLFRLYWWGSLSFTQNWSAPSPTT